MPRLIRAAAIRITRFRIFAFWLTFGFVIASAGAQASVRLSASSLGFGNQALHMTSSARSVTLTNGQSVALTISSIVASGDFAQTNNCGATLDANASCTISVTFTPSIMGSESGSATVTHSAGSSPLTLALSGVGTAPVTLSPAPSGSAAAAINAASSLSFGNQALNSPSSIKTVTLSNNQSAPLAISSIVPSGDFAETGACGTTVAANSTCAINVTFTPTALGSRSGTITISHNAGPNPLLVALSGTGVAPVTISGSLSFGNQALSTPSASKTATLTNNQNVVLNIGGIVMSGDFAQTGGTCGATVAAKGNCTIVVTFTPSALGNRTGPVTINHNAANTPTVLSLSGAGIVPATLSAASLAFGNQGLNSPSPAKTITLTNNQNMALNVTNIAVSGHFAQTSTCGVAIAAKGACTISVTYTPTVAGSETGSLTIKDDAPGGNPPVVSLSGSGAVSVTLSATTLAFGNQGLNSPSAAKTFTLTNNQGVALNISSMAVSGDFAQTGSCATVAAKSSCTISVTFTPTAVGARNGSVTINHDAPGSPAVVSLTGTGVAPVTLSAASLTFGFQAVNTTSPVKNVTLANNQGTPLNISSIAAGGNFARASTCGAVVAGKSSCTISVTYSPTALSSDSGSLTVTDDAGNSPQTLSLSGTGVVAVTLSTSSLSFSSQVMTTTSAAKTVTVTNNQSVSLNIGSITAAGDFAQTNTCGLVLAARNSCSIHVTFAPTIAGAESGVLTVNDDAPGSPQSIPLSGTGLAVKLVSLAVTPTNLTIPTGAAQQFTATGAYNSGSMQDVTNSVAWTSSSVAVAGIGNSAGSMGLASAVTVGSTTVTAALNGIQGSTPLTVVGKIVVTPRIASLTPFQALQFQATDTSPNNPTLVWSVDGTLGGNGPSGTITATGLYSPPSTAGAHTVTVAEQSDPTRTTSATVIVTNNPGVFTWHNDNGRTGQNLNEVALSPGDVSYTQFGKLFSYPVDGYVYAQPLYVENVTVAGGAHNVVYVATEHDSVFAFDADGLAAGPLWQASLLPAGATTVPNSDVNSSDIVPEIGITGTPVIDPVTGTLYVAAKSKENGAWVYRLHALDITSGAERPNSPVVIQASVPGGGVGGDGNGNVAFNARRQLQRPGLLLLNGVVYLAFGSHGDTAPYHGWLLGYDAPTLNQVAVFNATPNGTEGAFWEGGAAPAADGANRIYISSGNGTFDVDTGGSDYGDSFISLNFTGGSGLSVAGYFTPYNQAWMLQNDKDLGAGGLMALPDQPGPHPHLLIGGGKEGRLLMVDRDNMGGYNPAGDTQIVQSISSIARGIFSTPAYWQGNVYYLGSGGTLGVFQLNNGSLTQLAPAPPPTYGFPGATPSISANGSVNGIVWTLQTDQAKVSGPVVLHAYDATNVANELYNTNQAPNGRDVPGPAVKFTLPTVVNGKVYVGTQNQLNVYGLLP